MQDYKGLAPSFTCQGAGDQALTYASEFRTGNHFLLSLRRDKSVIKAKVSILHFLLPLSASSFSAVLPACFTLQEFAPPGRASLRRLKSGISTATFAGSRQATPTLNHVFQVLASTPNAVRAHDQICVSVLGAQPDEMTSTIRGLYRLGAKERSPAMAQAPGVTAMATSPIESGGGNQRTICLAACRQRSFKPTSSTSHR